MPQLGETRTANGQTRTWNGQGWALGGQAPAAPPGMLDSHGDDSPLMASLRGFGKGALEAATPTKLGLLAGLLTGGASVPAQMLAAGGAEGLAELAKVATGAEDAPKSFGAAAGNVALASGMAGVPAALGTAFRVGKSVLPEAGTAALNIAEHLPVIGNTVKATRGELPKLLDAALSGIRGETPGATQAAFNELPLAEQMDQLPIRSAKPVGASRTGVPVRSEIPEVAPEVPFHERPLYEQMEGTGSPEFQAFSGNDRVQIPPYAGPNATSGAVVDPPRLVKGGTLEDSLADVLDGLRGNGTDAAERVSVGSGPAPKVFDDGRAAGFDVSPRTEVPGPGAGADVSSTPPPSVSALPGDAHAAAEAHNIERNAPFGMGQIMPAPMRPTELLDAAAEGAEGGMPPGYFDHEYGKFIPDFTVEAGHPDIPGLTIGDTGSGPEQDLEDIIQGFLGEQGTGTGASVGDAAAATAAPGPQLSPAVREIPRDFDAFYGPEAQTLTGEPLQAAPMKGDAGYVPKGVGPNLLYDPQTPTQYLRQQLSDATDPNERDFLRRAIVQRMQMHLKSFAQ